MYISLFGLLCIVAGWVVQFRSSSKKKPFLDKNFLLLYAIGAGLLVLDSLPSILSLPVILNAISAVLAGALFWRMQK